MASKKTDVAVYDDDRLVVKLAARPVRLMPVASESWCKSTGRFTTSPSAYGLRNSDDRPVRSCR
jgi:hypothetical protein